MSLRSTLRPLLVLALTAAAQVLFAAPPAMPLQDVVETHHGTVVRDPYRALEDVKNPSTRAWFQAQGRYAAEQLAAIQGRDQLQARITELANASGDQLRSITRLPGDRLFYLKRRAGAGQFNRFTRDGLPGAERVLVNAEALTQTTGVPHAVNWYVPSWDGRRMAYGSRGRLRGRVDARDRCRQRRGADRPGAARS